MQQNTKVFKYI